MWNIKENTFCVETYILVTSLQETRRRFLSNFNLKHWQLNLNSVPTYLGVSWYRNGSTSFVIWGQWMKESHQGKSTTRQQVTIEQVVPSVQQSPKRSMIWPRAQAHQQNGSRRIMKEDCIDFYLHMNKYFFPSWSFAELFYWRTCARCQMDLSGLCWTETATCSIVVVWWSDLPG